MMEKEKKFLFINFGGLGDEILFLPAIISVKKEFPKSKIILALEPRSKGISSLTEVIDELMYADIKGKNKYFELLKLLFKIWFNRFDAVVSSGANKFIPIFLFLTLIPKRYGFDSGRLSRVLLTNAAKLNKNQYAAAMYHDLVRGITQYNTEIPQLSMLRKNPMPNSVLIHPGVSLMSIRKGMIKTIPAEIWAEVTERLSDLGKNVILAGGPDDEEVIKTIIEKVPPEKFTNMYGKTKNLKELAELISSAEIFVCSDSAPLHIAVALETKTYVIFGPTDDKKLIPQGKRVFPIKAKENHCQICPCLWEKRKKTCEDLFCLKMTSEEIVNTIMNIDKGEI